MLSNEVMDFKQETNMKTAINRKIQALCAAYTPVMANYHITDHSIQAEQRLTAQWKITLPIDTINYPKSLSAEGLETWRELNRVSSEIEAAATLSFQRLHHRAKINLKMKNSTAKRADSRAQFEIEAGRAFLAAYRKASGKRNLAKVRRQITALQAQQTNLLSQLRRANSDFIRDRRKKKLAGREAIAAGRFWEADGDLLKKYFTPPFEKNYLADVSERWRAALFLEVERATWYAGYNSLDTTGRVYLCGIDDNGDEWGYTIDLLPFRLCRGYQTTVEHAMAALFDVAPAALANCQRQGDLLLCPAEIPAEVTMTPQLDPWEVRESHQITSPGLERNGQYFRSNEEILVSHTSHTDITLPAGSYRLYLAEVDD